MGDPCCRFYWWSRGRHFPRFLGSPTIRVEMLRWSAWVRFGVDMVDVSHWEGYLNVCMHTCIMWRKMLNGYLKTFGATKARWSSSRRSEDRLICSPQGQARRCCVITLAVSRLLAILKWIAGRSRWKLLTGFLTAVIAIGFYPPSPPTFGEVDWVDPVIANESTAPCQIPVGHA